MPWPCNKDASEAVCGACHMLPKCYWKEEHSARACGPSTRKVWEKHLMHIICTMVWRLDCTVRPAHEPQCCTTQNTSRHLITHYHTKRRLKYTVTHRSTMLAYPELKIDKQHDAASTYVASICAADRLDERRNQPHQDLYKDVYSCAEC